MAERATVYLIPWYETYIVSSASLTLVNLSRNPLFTQPPVEIGYKSASYNVDLRRHDELRTAVVAA